MKSLVRSIQLLAWAAFVGALVKELKKPEAERAWHGEVLGFVPYDFRVPSADKVRAAYWAPEREELFSRTVFGVGWAVNVPVAAQRISTYIGPLVAKVRAKAGAEADAGPSGS